MTTSIKTAISMQEELFKEVNKLAGEMHVSRSRLFVMAVQDFIEKKKSHNLLSQINNAFNDHPDSEEIKIQSQMRKKQTRKLEKELW